MEQEPTTIKTKVIASATGPWRLRVCLLIALLAVAILLRFTGLRWGIPAADLPHPPLHPDEIWSVAVMAQMNPELRDFNPDEAHREGTCAYFLWSGAGELARALGLIEKRPHQFVVYDQDYRRYLLLSRAVVALLDTCSVGLVFLVVFLLTGNFSGAYWGAAVFTVTPFEVIYSHYMRTHAVSNFFLLLSLLATVRLFRNLSVPGVLLAGFFGGLTFATRYPAGAIGIVPFGVIAAQVFQNSFQMRGLVLRVVFSLVNRYQLLLPLAALVGVMVADPYLFLDFKGAWQHIAFQASFSDTSEFSGANLWRLSRVFEYLSELIPAGTRPALWLLMYAGVLSAPWLRPYRKFSIPLVLFILLYLFSMSKGYLGMAWYVRAMMAFFPTAAILFGVLMSVLVASRPQSVLVRLVQGGAAGLVLASFLFSYAYVRAMAGEDVRIRLARYFQGGLPQHEVVRVGVYSASLSYFVEAPTLDVLTRPKIVREDIRDSSEPPPGLNYVLLSAFERPDYDLLAKRLAALVDSGRFREVALFQNVPSILGIKFPVAGMPHDVVYPFPTLVLLQPVSAELS